MMLKCVKCDKDFVTKTAFNMHVSSHEEDGGARRRGRPGSKIPCGDCDEVFFRRCDLRLHRRMVHQPKRNTCDVCSRSFTNERRLKMHYQFHNVGGEYECFYCMKEFNKGWKLKIHLVNHNGKPPYICQYCDEDFLYPGKILDHLKREHDVCLACRDCGEAFRNTGEQDKHACKLYGCKDCDVSFCTSKELACHAELHKLKTENPASAQTTPQVTPSNKVSPSNEAKTPLPDCEVIASICRHSEVPMPPRLPIEVVDVPWKPSGEIVRQRTDTKEPDPNDSAKYVLQLLNYEMSKHDINMANKQILSKENILRVENETREVLGARNLVLDGGVNVSYTFNPDTETGLSWVNDKAAASNPSDSHIVSEEMSNGSIYSFKVPKSGLISAKRFINILKRKPENGTKHAVHEWEFALDKNSLVRPEQASLKSWLTSDNTPCVTNDFVFGMGAKEPERLLDSTYKSCKIKLKKEEYEMSFEDLCQF